MIHVNLYKKLKKLKFLWILIQKKKMKKILILLKTQIAVIMTAICQLKFVKMTRKKLKDLKKY